MFLIGANIIFWECLGVEISSCYMNILSVLKFVQHSHKRALAKKDVYFSILGG